MKPELVVIAGQQTAVNTFSDLVQIKMRLPRINSSERESHWKEISFLKRKNSPTAVRLGMKGLSSKDQLEVETASPFDDPAYKWRSHLLITSGGVNGLKMILK